MRRLSALRPGWGLLALAGLLAADAILWSRSFGRAANFDEGGYTVALEALRDGQALGEEVFLVQPPLFYNLLQALGALIGPSFDELRAGMLVVSLVGVAAAFVLGRAYGGDWAGLGAAAVYSVTPPFPANAPLIEADPPAVTLALVALAFAVHGYGRGRSGTLAYLAGAAIAASILVKLFTVSTSTDRPPARVSTSCLVVARFQTASAISGANAVTVKSFTRIDAAIAAPARYARAPDRPRP